MTLCEKCIHKDVCGARDCYDEDDERALVYCSDFLEIVRCKDCMFTTELDKHCEYNRTAYRHCTLWRGDETRNVWHRYKKYYKDYSIVDLDGFCSEGIRKEG